MRRISLLPFLAIVALGACNGREPTAPTAGNVPLAASTRPGKTFIADLTGYNHTDKTIAAFYVNGQWGGNIFPGTGGGKFVCCIALPVRWQDGTKVTVSWEDHELKTHSREVGVPRYTSDGGGMTVHFLRDGQIKVFVGMTFLGHPDYPLKGKEAELKPGVPVNIRN